MNTICVLARLSWPRRHRVGPPRHGHPAIGRPRHPRQPAEHPQLELLGTTAPGDETRHSALPDGQL